MILLYLLIIISVTDGEFLFFERDSYVFNVSETTPINTKIGVITATSSSSLSIQYKLYGDTNKTFDLNSLTGELILINSLDYEIISIYKLTIEAHSSSSSSSIAPCFSEITIDILNINDNPPEINLIFYPTVLFESNIIKYDMNTYSTSLGIINLKDLDISTKNLSLIINDTKHFQIQFIRQIKISSITESIYILSTKNNSLLIENEYYYLSLNSCDNDQPSLWTNRSYELHIKPNENLCSFENNQILNIKENLPNRTLISSKLTNKFCQNLIYSIDDTTNFYINSQTGYLYTSKIFNRIERSIYSLNLKGIDQYNKQIKTKLIIQIIDQYNHIPFLTKKKFVSNRNDFISINLYNSTYCRYQSTIYNYFQLLNNCTLRILSLPKQGKYLFSIELNDKTNYQDTFLLELTSNIDENFLVLFIQSQWIMIIPIVLGIFFILIIIMCAMMIIRKKRYNQLLHNKQKSSSLTSSEETVHNKYDAISNLSKLKVHDDHELTSSPISTTIYLIQKTSSSPLSSSSPARDDEGYSGSSDVSENHLPVETTIISANHLLEQYRIHEFRTRQSISPLSKRINTTCISPDISLV